MRDEMTVVDGYELRDLKRNLLFAEKISFGFLNGKPTLIITPENGQGIETIVWANTIPKKEIA
jgi:hypothetical protein